MVKIGSHWSDRFPAEPHKANAIDLSSIVPTKFAEDRAVHLLAYPSLKHLVSGLRHAAALGWASAREVVPVATFGTTSGIWFD